MKSLNVNRFNRSRNRDPFQPGILKGTNAYGLHTLGNFNFLKRRAVTEGAGTDRFDAPLQMHCFQCFAISKSIGIILYSRRYRYLFYWAFTEDGRFYSNGEPVDFIRKNEPAVGSGILCDNRHIFYHFIFKISLDFCGRNGSRLVVSGADRPKNQILDFRILPSFGRGIIVYDDRLFSLGIQRIAFQIFRLIA